MLKAALCGSYVNFGVFRLYGDDALDNALNSFVKLLLSIPQSDLLVSFKKDRQTLFGSRLFLSRYFLRIIPNCLRPTTCFWNVWLKTT